MYIGKTFICQIADLKIKKKRVANLRGPFPRLRLSVQQVFFEEMSQRWPAAVGKTVGFDRFEN